jgi:flagellar biosynthesis protein FlhG
MRRVIAIASGKGGVGKTVVAIGLAQALAEAGRDVTLVDADPGLANAHVQLGLDPPLDLVHVVARRATAEAALMRHPAGFRLLAGRGGEAGRAALDHPGLPALLGSLPSGFVILDLGAGIGSAQRRLSAAADDLLVLLTDEPTSLTDAYAVLKLHARDAPGRRAHAVASNVPGAEAGRRAHAALAEAARRFLGLEVPLLGSVRRDPRVPEAIRAQVPLLTRHPNSAAARDIHALAAAITAGPG